MTINLVCAVFLATPWLVSATSGPINPMLQLLTTWVCIAVWVVLSFNVKGACYSRTQQVASAWIIGAVLSALAALIQYFGNAEYFQPWVAYTTSGEAYGNLRQRNHQATLLTIGICSLLWWKSRLADWRATSPCQSYVVNFLIGLGLTLLAVASSASGSRTGLLQLLMLLCLSICWRSGRCIMIIVLLTYALAAFSLPLLAGLDPLHSGILGRTGDAAIKCSSRLTLWSNVFELIKQKPWTGWGWGELSYAHFITLYQGERFCEIMGNAHNLPLHLAVELGVPVALMVCGGVFWLGIRNQPWRERDVTRQMAWSVLLAIGLHSLLEYPLWYGPFQLATVLAVGLLLTTRPRLARTSGSEAVEKPQSQITFKAIRGATVLASLLLMACIYTAREYWLVSQIYLPAERRDPVYKHEILKKIYQTIIFQQQAKFAELSIATVNPQTAGHIQEISLEILHFSPEPMVVEKLIESAEKLGNNGEAQYYIQRYKAAYQQDYERWRRSHY